MYSAIEVRDEMRPLITVSETTDINYRAHFALAQLRAYAADWGAFTVRLTRNLRDDSFSVTLTGDAHANLFGDRTRDAGHLYKYTQINVNNKYGGHNANPGGAYVRGESTDFIHHSILASVPFREASLISFDWLVDNAPASPLNFLKHLINLTLTLVHHDVPTTLNLQSNEVGFIKSLKELRISFNPGAMSTTASSLTVVPPTMAPFKVETFYNYFVVLPLALSQTNQTSDVASLYVFNDGGLASINDYQTKSVAYQSSSGAGSLEATIVNDKFDAAPFRFHVATGGSELKTLDYVGTVRVFEMTHYDYARQAVVKGLASKARPGDLVPFNFKGEFVQQIDFGPNAPFKKLKLRINHHFPRPQLDPFTGYVKLEVQEVVVDTKPQRCLSLASIKRLREQVELKSPLDLIALERLSD